jgi:hypothetical protein
MRRRTFFAIVVLCMVSGGAETPASVQSAEAEITLQPMKYSELGKFIRGLKGKVVLVNFWADY